MNDGQATGSLRAGVAKSDITTSEPGVKVNDPLYAKALVLDDGETKVVILAVDAVAIGGICDIQDDFLGKLRRRIEGELGVPAGHVLVNASHTHTPDRMVCEDAEQLSRTFDAVKRAMANMTPVTVGVGVGHEDRFVINRTLRLKSGLHWTIRHANPCPPDDEVDGLGPVDPRYRHPPFRQGRRPPPGRALQLRLPPAGGRSRPARDGQLPRFRLQGH